MTHSDQTDIHGQRKTYMRGCRCAPCKAAAAAYRKRWAAETGAEKRVGKRGEQKRAYEARVRELR